MYKILTIRDKVRVPPAKFGMNMNEAIKQSLQEQIEGKLHPEIGLFLAVTDILNVSEGEILPEDGAIHYTAECKALSFAPEVNEMIMGEVVDITAFGAFTRIGPMDALIHVSQVMDDKCTYNEKLATLIGKKTGIKLQQGAIVRARVASVSLGKGGRSKIALTMRQPSLGAVEWIEKDKKAKKKEEVKK
jgi:DNA-directed RNA polymerase subunit E'